MLPGIEAPDFATLATDLGSTLAVWRVNGPGCGVSRTVTDLPWSHPGSTCPTRTSISGIFSSEGLQGYFLFHILEISKAVEFGYQLPLRPPDLLGRSFHLGKGQGQPGERVWRGQLKWGGGWRLHPVGRCCGSPWRKAVWGDPLTDLLSLCCPNVEKVCDIQGHRWQSWDLRSNHREADPSPISEGTPFCSELSVAGWNDKRKQAQHHGRS